MPQAANSPVAISKGMDHFQFIVEYAAFDQQVDVAVLNPIQQFHSEFRCIIRQSTKVQYVTLLVHYTHRTGAEATGFFGQPSGHHRVGIQ